MKPKDTRLEDIVVETNLNWRLMRDAFVACWRNMTEEQRQTVYGQFMRDREMSMGLD